MPFNIHNHTLGFRIQLDMNVWNWLCVVGIFIFTGILILALCLNIRPFKKYVSTNKDKSQLIVFLSICTIITFTLSTICMCIGIILVMLSDDFQHYYLINDIFLKCAFGLYLLSQTLMVFLFVIRIDLSFKDSIIAYSRLVIISLRLGAIIFALFYVCILIYLIFELWYALLVLLTIWIILYFLMTSALSFLFIRKVEQLMISTKCVDKEFLSIVIKHAILVPIAICSSFICFLFALFIEITIGKTLTMTPVAVFWIVLDCTISTLSIYLFFLFNKKYYYKYCSFLHQQCEKRKLSSFQEKHLNPDTNGNESKSTHNSNNISTVNKSDSSKTTHDTDKISTFNKLDSFITVNNDMNNNKHTNWIDPEIPNTPETLLIESNLTDAFKIVTIVSQGEKSKLEIIKIED